MNLINETQAAAMLGVRPKTMTMWRYRRRGPAYVRISRRCVRYSPLEIARYVVAHS